MNQIIFRGGCQTFITSC